MPEEMGLGKIVILGFLCLIGLFGLGWLAQGNDFFLYKVFAPKVEGVRRQTFEQSKAYNQGVVQELDKQYQDYAKANKDEKEAIASIALHQVVDYPVSLLPDYLRTFVEKLRADQATR